MRPRFELIVPFPPAEVFARLEARLACAGCPCQAVVVRRTIGDVVQRTLDVMVAPPLRHVWSPVLGLEIDAHPQGARLHGMFGPNPAVWTAILFAWAFLGLSSLFSGMLGLTQLALGMTPSGLAVVAGCALLAALPWLASRVGQAKAAQQMELLRCFLSASLGLPEHAPPPEPLDAACPRPAGG
jgi:hypothetical protein